MLLRRVGMALMLPGLVALGCAGGVGMADGGSTPPPVWSPPVTVAPVTVPVATRPAFTAFATATPFPTFTPEPTRGPAPLPSGVVVSLPTPQQTPTPISTPATGMGSTPLPGPKPTATPRVLPTVDVTALDVGSFTATPTPAAYQLVIPDTDVRVARQTVFMSHYPKMPDFWPTPSNVFYARTARFIGWRVELDYTDVDDDFEMTGLMRWLNVSAGEHVIYQEPYTISKGLNLEFLMGQPVPGFWSPGRYRLELWDNRDRVAVYYDFEVRSGVTQ